MKKGSRYVIVSTRRPITLGDQIGAGGEAAVFHVKEEPAFAAKIYFKTIPPNTLNKLRYMLANPPVDSTFTQSHHYSIAWPTELLADSKGTIIGFLMPKIGRAHKLSTIIGTKSRERENILYDHRHFYNIAMNLATVVKNIHQKGYVIGDLNTDNFMVSSDNKTLTLMTVIDCDSFQVTDSSGTTYRCTVGKSEYTAPEFQHLTNFGAADRTQQSDLFALAVIIYQLLMQGVHPFQGVDLNPSREIEMAQVYCIKHNIFPHLANPEFKRGPFAPKFTVLPRPLQDLFLQAFIGGRNYIRPSAEQWVQTLNKLNASLTTCSQTSSHIHPKNYPCIMCEWEIIVGKRGRGNAPELPELKESALPKAMPAPVRPVSQPKPPAPVQQQPKPPSRKQPTTTVAAPTPPSTTHTFTKNSITLGAVSIDRLTNHEIQPYRTAPSQSHHQHVVVTNEHVYAINGRGTVFGYPLENKTPPTISRDARNCIALAAGDEHCVVLRADGKVFAWGSNEYGQSNVPSTLNNATAIAAKQYYSMALTADHNVVVWGDDDYGVCDVPSVLNQNTRSIAAGLGHCAAITQDGRVIVWGNLIHMQQSIDTHFNGKASAVAIAADNDATLILDTNQMLWYFNDEQTPPTKLLIARDINTVKFIYLVDSFAFLGVDQNRIQFVDMIKSTKLNYMRTSTPPYHGMINFYPTGDSFVIQTPTHINIVNRDKPSMDSRSFSYQIGLSSRLTQLHTNTTRLRLHQLQHVYRQTSHLACGDEYVAVLHKQRIHVFGTLDVQTNAKITQIYGHTSHLIAIDSQQRASVFGTNLGLGAQIPNQIQGRILSVCTYANHGIAAITGELISGWGDNSHNQLNNPKVEHMVAVATGLHHSLALLDNGRIVAWGDNKFGQINVPNDLEDVVQICAAGNMSAALRKDGSVCIWGELTPRTASTFDGLTNVTAIALGPTHGAILFNDGSVRTWGQIDTKHVMPPTTADPVIAIACGNGYTAALTISRRVIAWGAVSLDQQLPE